jgi:hypothetical protein
VSSKSKRRPHRGEPHSERWWTAEEAHQIRRRLCSWLATRDGIAATYLHYLTIYHGEFPADVDGPALARDTAIASADELADADLLWCDPAMVDLLSAAADSYPPEPWRPELLLAPGGIVVFSKPLPAVWVEAGSDVEEAANISAITWASSVADSGQDTLSVVGWKRQARPQVFDVVGRVGFAAGLAVHSSAIGLYGRPLADKGGPANAARILMTLTALLRSPLVRDEVAPRPAPRSNGSRQVTDPPIRRVYLRRPEDGQAELEAARDSRAGRAPRGHWVRGHWKRQWHPSVQQHRQRWIEGYARGDFDLGQVHGTKVLIAHAKDSESEQSD